MAGYRIWVSDDRCTLVRLANDGSWCEVATRPDPDAIWGPPIRMRAEQ